MKRGTFISVSAAGVIGLSVHPAKLFAQNHQQPAVRLGGPVFEKFNSPEEWVQLLKKKNYTAAYCPVNPGTESTLIEQYRKAAQQSGIIIAEVGAWSNPLSPDGETARKAIDKCIESLSLAEEIGARCCVNISGSRNPDYWAGPHPDNLSDNTFDQIVEVTRKIIDAVKPTRTWFTLEAMPWAYPDSVDSYLHLIRAIDRKGFSVHLDPVNMVTSPQVLYNNGAMIRKAFRELGPYIKSCHAKDVNIRDKTDLPQLEEVRPGLGLLDYRIFLEELSGLQDVPLMLEHLDSSEEYDQAAAYIRSVGKSLSLGF